MTTDTADAIRERLSTRGLVEIDGWYIPAACDHEEQS